MKMVKSLLLGSAAGLVAIAGAQAADLPVKAKPVQYVKICSLYGAGFYYIPGTDTCMKLGGWVRVEIGLNGANSGAVFNNGGGGRDTRVDNSYASMRSRFVITTDTRTQTEYGTLRTYTRAGMQASYQDYNQGGTYFERAFIQLGGFTFGKTQSFFDFMGGAFSYSGYYGGYSNTGAGGTNLFAYTASFGNGLSATISAEDPTIRYGVVWDWTNTLTIGSAPGPFSLTSSSYPGGGAAAIGNQRAQVPDLVANFRVDQAWGSAQIAGALHQLRAGFYGNAPAAGSPGDAWGWAIAGGASVNLPWAKGDRAFVEATYTQGAMCYVGLCQNGTQMAYDRWTSTSIGFAWAFDSVFNPVGNGSQQLTEAWAITGGVEHYWKPNLRTSLYAAYTAVNYNATAAALFCTSAITGTTTGTTATPRAGCNPDFSELAIGTKTVWNPAPGLDVGLELLYTNLHTNNTGSVTTTAAQGGRVAGLYTFDQDLGVFQGLFRIQRNFWP